VAAAIEAKAAPIMSKAGKILIKPEVLIFNNSKASFLPEGVSSLSKILLRVLPSDSNLSLTLVRLKSSFRVSFNAPKILIPLPSCLISARFLVKL
jgi:hypothetical protein